jgi:hypothetical protein
MPLSATCLRVSPIADTRGKRLLQLQEYLLPTGVERVAIRNVRKRHFSARRAWRTCLRRAYWGFATAALIFLQTLTKTAFCSDGVRLSSGFEISFAA